MEAKGLWKGGYETRLEDDRGHVVTVDLPVDEGGRNAGTSALELMVLSLAGCVSTVFTLVAEKRRLAFSGLHVSLSAERRPGAPTIERVHGEVEVETHAPKEDVETALRLTLKSCPVGVLLRHAHVPVEVVARVVVPPPVKEAELPYEIPEPEWAL